MVGNNSGNRNMNNDKIVFHCVHHERAVYTHVRNPQVFEVIINVTVLYYVLCVYTSTKKKKKISHDQGPFMRLLQQYYYVCPRHDNAAR